MQPKSIEQDLASFSIRSRIRNTMSSIVILFQYIHIRQWFIRPILHLQNTCPAFQCMNRVPNTYWNAHSHIEAIRLQYKRIGTYPFKFIIILHPKLAPQAHHRFRCLLMPMNWQNTPWLDSIQHSLRTIYIRIPQVKIHPLSLRSLCLFCQAI